MKIPALFLVLATAISVASPAAWSFPNFNHSHMFGSGTSSLAGSVASNNNLSGIVNGGGLANSNNWRNRYGSGLLSRVPFINKVVPSNYATGTYNNAYNPGYNQAYNPGYNQAYNPAAYGGAGMGSCGGGGLMSNVGSMFGGGGGYGSNYMGNSSGYGGSPYAQNMMGYGSSNPYISGMNGMNGMNGMWPHHHHHHHHHQFS